MRRVASILIATALCATCSVARAPEDEVAQIARLMELRAGMRVADVGAGDGEYSEALAERVGPTGHLFSTEVEQEDVDELADRLERAGFANTTAVLGDQQTLGLPDDCCDAILLRLVYHHFTEPEQMRESLRRALRPGGRLVVIDIRIQESWELLDGVPDRGGHGIPPEALIEEMTGDGFNVVERLESWPEDDDHFCVVFEED